MVRPFNISTIGCIYYYCKQSHPSRFSSKKNTFFSTKHMQGVPVDGKGLYMDHFMSGSNRRSAPPSINLIEGFVMLSFKQSNLEYVSGNKSPLTSLRCFPSFKTRLTCHEHFDPYEKQNRGNPQHTPSTKPEPHLQMVTWTVLLAQIQVMRQTANAYPWKIRIVSNEQLLQEKHPTPAVSMVGSLGKIWLLSSGVKTVNSNATSQQPSEISTSHEFNQNVPHVTKR